MFNPFEAMARHCNQHQINPVFMLSALIDALAPHHRFGRKGAMSLRPPGAAGVKAETVHDHIIGLCQDAERDHEADPPSSLLEVLELAAFKAQRDNEWTADQYEQNPDPLHQEQIDKRIEIHRQIAKSQEVLRLIFRDCMNELEREGLEYGMRLDEEFPGED